jgi:hypothetical protein
MADKLDLVKQHKEAYSRKKTPHIFEMPSMRYLAIEGKGAPEGQGFMDGIGAIYSTAYPLKFTWIKEGGQDYKIAPMEAQWWLEDPTVTWEFAQQDRESWCWRVMIALPEFVTEDAVDRVKATQAQKKPELPVADVGVVTMEEGTVVQCLHLGPYSGETETIRKMHDHAQTQGYEFTGRHREIYLNDPNRTRPENLKTILRHPVIKM